MALTMSKKSEKLCSSSSCSVCLCQINTGKGAPFFSQSKWCTFNRMPQRPVLHLHVWMTGQDQKKCECVCVYVCLALCQLIVLPPKHRLFKTTGFVTSKPCITLWRAGNVFQVPSPIRILTSIQKAPNPPTHSHSKKTGHFLLAY